MYSPLRVLRNHVKELFFTSILASALLAEIACGTPAPTSTPSPTPTPRTYENRTLKQREYEVIPINEWSPSVSEWRENYSHGKLRDAYNPNELVVEKIVRSYNQGSPREYVTLRESGTSKLHFVTIDVTKSSGGITDIDEPEEIVKRIRNREPEIYSSVLTAVANNQSPIPAIEKFTGTKNPEVNGRILMSTLGDTNMAYFADGEIYPFVPWYLSFSKDKAEVGFEVNIEAVAFYYAMSHLGLDVQIPFTEKSLGIIGGGLVAQNPDSTKVKVRFEYDGKNVAVVGENNRSLLVRVLENVYYGLQDGSLAAQVQNDINSIAGSVEALTRVRQADNSYSGRQDRANPFQGLERVLAGASETPQQKRQREEQERQQIEKIGRDLEKVGEEVDATYQQLCKDVRKQASVELPGCSK